MELTPGQIDYLAEMDICEFDPRLPLDEGLKQSLAAIAQAGPPDRLVVSLTIRPAADNEEPHDMPVVGNMMTTQTVMVLSLSKLLADYEDPDKMDKVDDAWLFTDDEETEGDQKETS